MSADHAADLWDLAPGRMPPAGTPVNLGRIEPENLLALVKKAGGQREFSRKYHVKRTTLQKRLYKLRTDPFQHRPAPVAREVVHEAGRQRFILSSAQDKSRVHEPFLRNLEAYRDHLKGDAPCELMIGGFTYSKKLFEDHDPNQSWFHKLVVPYLTNERIRIADKIDFCGEMNTLPTAEKPLSGFHTYTQGRWGIFPHAKVQLVSVPTMKNQPANQIMTTGAVTMPNYIHKKAGIKASFHHVYGAVLVEVDGDGTFFCRHLIADDSGDFYDLDAFVSGGQVSTGFRLKALTPGDVHTAQIDPDVARVTFGCAPVEDLPSNPVSGRLWKSEPSCMLDELKPEYLFIHDVSDFRARNHHEIKNPHIRFKHHVNGVESVEKELREVAAFLTTVQRGRPWMQTVVVESNHDKALLKWLETADYREDPVNAEFFLECQKATYAAIRQRIKKFSIFEWVMKTLYDPWTCDGVRFLRQDDDFVIGGVEHSNHGHKGPNGTRGTATSFVKIAARVTIGHIHTPQILDGVFVSGTSSKMDLGYNDGPSSWAHAHVGQYANGKRVILTICNGRYRL